ncbi:MAG: dihydropteroate synthase [Patescibacteria group bacterium]|nr:dihydropteroate synthase [Patescibacteria group bacterium]
MFMRGFKSQEEFGDFLIAKGVTGGGVMQMSGKGVLNILEIPEIDTRAANILKQECLSIGAELALPKEAAGFKQGKVWGALILTNKQAEKLYEKLQAQPFGLKDLAQEMRDILGNYGRTEFALKSPHGREVSLENTQVMGICNATPDSLFDGGSVREMIEAGASIIDIGGESTGPGSKDVSGGEELERVLPIITEVRRDFPDVFISIDTYKADVAANAIEAGVDMVNDVTAGRGDERMFSVVSDLEVPYIMMYAKDATARTTTDEVEYEDVMRTIIEFLESRVQSLGSNVIVDPGMGAFVSGNPRYSYEILSRLDELRVLGCPVLVGASRKSFLGGEVSDRLEGSLAAACAAAMNGAKIIRAHDVEQTVKALKVCNNLYK